MNRSGEISEELAAKPSQANSAALSLLEDFHGTKLPEDKVAGDCTAHKLFLDSQNHLNSRLELRDLATNNLRSSRTEIFTPFHEARIDVSVTSPEGKTRYYEEYPTPVTSPIPLPYFEKIAGPVYKYDPVKDARIGGPLDKNSAEYKEAYAALTRVREVETPQHVIWSLLGGPSCP